MLLKDNILNMFTSLRSVQYSFFLVQKNVIQEDALKWSILTVKKSIMLQRILFQINAVI